jgi:hypothetical protein
MGKIIPEGVRQSQPDLEKLGNLTHYICYQCHDPSVLGATKLNKVLWYSDLLAFLKLGHSITGERYIKRQFGPVPEHILGVVEELESKDALVVRDVEFFGKQKTEYVALTEPDISMFKPEEISIVDSIIDVVCHKHTATSISMASHDVIWKLAEIGEEIPMSAVLVSELGEVIEDDIKWAQKGLADREAKVG